MVASQGGSLERAQGQCRGCREDGTLPLVFTMAFQPIVRLEPGATATVWGYEALVRGENGESAASVLAQVTDATLYRFDQACRVRAIEMAGSLFPDTTTKLSINFMPNAVYEPSACIRASLTAARRVGFRAEQLAFEFTETERMADPEHVANIISRYREIGLLTALDDFGSGYSGLVRLARLQPDLLKIDMALVRGIDADRARQAIVAAILKLAADLNIQVIAEGIETAEECRSLRDAGVTLFQGYYFAKPQTGALPPLAATA